MRSALLTSGFLTPGCAGGEEYCFVYDLLELIIESSHPERDRHVAQLSAK